MKRKVESAVIHVACFLLGCIVTFFVTARYIDYHSACWETAKNADDSNKQMDEFLRSIIQSNVQSKELEEWLKREPERRSPLDAPVVPLRQGNAGTG